MNEQAIISMCSQKKAKAQKQLFDHFVNKMYRLCFRYVKQHFDAEDIMIKGFHKVFKHIETFEYRGEGSLEKWIKTIMINESLMFLRKKQRLDTISSDEFLQNESMDFEVNDIDAEMIYALIVELPEGYRTVINLYVLDGLSHDEISQKLGISVNTSKSQLSRARSLLKKQILKHQSYGK